MDETRSLQANWRRVDWSVLLNRLTACALRWFREKGCMEPGSVLPGTGMSAVDLVYDTLLDLLKEENNSWFLQPKCEDLFPYALMAMRHNFLNLVRKKEYTRTVIADGALRDEVQHEVDNLSDKTDPFAPANAAVLVKKLYVILGDDEELKEYVDAWLMKGLEKRADIAYDLGISEQEATNRRRRLLYKLKPWRQMLTRSGINKRS